MSPKVWLSPRISTDDFPAGHHVSLDDKIRVFEDRVLGWQLEPAAQLIGSNQHAGFATLHIVGSYFEMVGMALLGKRGPSTIASKSRRKRKKRAQQLTRTAHEYFESGVRDVFPSLSTKKRRHARWFAAAFWGDVRCRLYHEGITGPGVYLSGGHSEPYVFGDCGPGRHRIILNPTALVSHINNHFNDFVSRLRDSKNADLRSNFEWLFDQVPR